MTLMPVDATECPELVFGLVGPIGVSMDLVARKLEQALVAVRYRPSSIRLTALMMNVAIDGVEIADESNRLQHYVSRIEYANAVRKKCDDDAALAALAISEIRRLRAERWETSDIQGDPENLPHERTAYILRQLKRPEETSLLRTVYGRKFIQIAVHASEKNRRRSLVRSFAQSDPSLTPSACEEAADELIARDLNERSEDHGQRLEDVFHLGEAFIDGTNEETIERSLNRFIFAFFGKNSISPNRDEYGGLYCGIRCFAVDRSRSSGRRSNLFTTRRSYRSRM